MANRKRKIAGNLSESPKTKKIRGVDAEDIFSPGPSGTERQTRKSVVQVKEVKA